MSGAEKLVGPFFSTVLKALKDLPARKMTGKEMDSLLVKYGAKPRELNYIREQIGRQQAPTLSPEEVVNPRSDSVMEALAGGLPRLSESKYGTNALSEEQNYSRFLNESELGMDDMPDYGTREWHAMFNGRPSRPDEDYNMADAWADHLAQSSASDARYGEYTSNHPYDKYEEYLLKSKDPTQKYNYDTSHWPDDTNVVYHSRYSTADFPIDKDGSDEGLLIEEIQSDMNQAGRKNGYMRSDMTYDKAVDERERAWQDRLKIRKYYENGQIDKEEYEAASAAAIAEHDRRRMIVHGLSSGNVAPTNPLMKTDQWTESALRRAIVEMGDRGHSRLGWTSGETQGKRYGGDPLRDEGMKGYYDKIVPSALSKLIGKYDNAKILRPGDSGMPGHWSADVPAELIEKYQREGIPLFKRGGRVT